MCSCITITAFANSARCAFYAHMLHLSGNHVTAIGYATCQGQCTCACPVQYTTCSMILQSLVMSAFMRAGLEGEGQPCACFLAQKARGQQHLGLLRVAPSPPPSQQHQPQLHFTMVSTRSVGQRA